MEGVGGLYSPMASDGHNLDLIERTKPDLVVVVASAAIGGIHDAMAGTLPLSAHRQAIFLNRYDPRAEVHLLNVRWLRDTGPRRRDHRARTGRHRLRSRTLQ